MTFVAGYQPIQVLIVTFGANVGGTPITEDKVLDQLILQTTPMDFTLSARVVGIVLFEANNPDLGDNAVYQRLMALARIGKLEIKQTKGCRANVCDTNAIYELPMRDTEVRLKTPLK